MKISPPTAATAHNGVGACCRSCSFSPRLSAVSLSWSLWESWVAIRCGVGQFLCPFDEPSDGLPAGLWLAVLRGALRVAGGGLCRISTLAARGFSGGS